MYKMRYKTPVGFSNIIMDSDGEHLTGLWFEGSRDSKKHSIICEEKNLPIFEETCKWLDIYFSGKNPSFIPKYKIIGIKTLFNKKTSDKVEQDKTIENNTTEQTRENTNSETKKGQENLKDEVKSDISESQNKETKEEINIVSQPTDTETINNFGVCILSISFIFLIITIIFSIIFAKYQLKLRKKLSK